MKRRIKALAVIMAAVLMVSGAGSTLYENGVKADAKDTLKWNSAITKVKVKKRVALTVNVEVLFDDELPVERLEADGADVGALLVPHDLLRQFDG